MADENEHTISGLLRKRAELLGEVQRYTERVAAATNAIACIDRVLEAFDYQGTLVGMKPSGMRNLLVDRHSVSRFILDELRSGARGFSSREMATKIIVLDGLDPMDKKLLDSMINRVGKVLRTLRRHGVVAGLRDDVGMMRWSLVD